MPRSTSLNVTAALSREGAAAEAGASWAAAVPATDRSATAGPIKLERRMPGSLYPSRRLSRPLLPGLLEEERIGHHHHAAALGLGEHPGADAAGHAHLQLGVADGGLGHRRGRHRPDRGDDELHRHLALEVGEAGQLRLVAVPDLVAVRTDDLADQLLVQRAHDLRVRGGDADVRDLLAAQHAHAVAVGAGAAAAALGADGADADGVAHAAAPAAGAAQAEAAEALGVARAGAEQAAHGRGQLTAQAVGAEHRGEAAALPAEDAVGEHARLVLLVRLALGRHVRVALVGRVLAARLALAAGVLGGHLAGLLLLLLGQLLQEGVLLRLG